MGIMPKNHYLYNLFVKLHSMSDYKNIKQLAEALHLSIDKMEQGTLSIDQLEELVGNSRELYERLIVLRFKSYESSVKTEVKEQETTGDEMLDDKSATAAPPEEISENPKEETESEQEENSSKIKEKKEPYLSPNQTSLIDAIQEQEKMLSINDKLGTSSDQQKSSLADKFKKSKIDNLKTAIGINQKFLFMNDLFEGDNEKYNEALEEINSAENKEVAFQKINSYKESYSWNEETKSYRVFVEIVERKFS